jgi:hypothetical protein
MMSHKFSITLSLALTICSATAAIDLTPTLREYTSEGIIYRQIKLKREGGTITFVPPRDWNVRGGKDRLQLQPPDKNFVEATITAMPLPAPKPFDEPTVKALEQRVLSEAPAGSQSAQVLRREENPVAMGQYLSLEIVISYTTLGRTFQRSAIFVHTPDTELVFRFTAPKEDFALLNAAFRRSIGSWQWIEQRATASPGPATVSN